MFQRALKTQFNEQKYLQVSTVRLRRLEPEAMCLKGKRIAMIFGFFFTFHLIRYYRKAPSHKVCYVPIRKGLMKMNEDHYLNLVSKSEGYGAFYPPKGRAYV